MIRILGAIVAIIAATIWAIAASNQPSPAPYPTHASLLSSVTLYIGPTISQAEFTAGNGGGATYVWNPSSFCPGGTSGSPVATDDIVCIFPGHTAPYTSSTPGRYLLQIGNSINVRMVGMAPGGQDNSPYISALMTAIATSTAGVNGPDVIFSSDPGLSRTTYVFHQPFVLSRGARYHCSGTTGRFPSVILLFDAGMNGVIQSSASYSSDGGQGSGTLDGCSVYSNGFTYNASMAGGSSSVTGATMLQDPGQVLPTPTWNIGDGIFITPLYASQGPQQVIPVTPPGTTVTNVAGTTLTVSNAANAQFGAAQQIFSESPVGPLSNFVAGDQITLGNDTWTFVSAIGSTPGNVLLGTSWYASAVNLAACINLNTTTTTCVAQSTTPNVTADTPFINSPLITFWAAVGGTGGNSLTSTYTPIGTSAGSLKGATFGSGSGIFTGRTPPVAIYQYPATQAYTVNTVINTKAITVTSGPSANSTRLIRPGDYIYSKAFQYWTTVLSVSGSGGSQTVNVTNNATASDTGDPLWVMPAGLKREVIAYASNDSYWGWAFGLNQTCSTAFPFNCDGSQDSLNFYDHNLIGRLDSGNNMGACGSYGEVAQDSFITDLIAGGAVGCGYANFNSNSMEAATSHWGPLVNCAASAFSTFSPGGYWGGLYYNPCISPTTLIPPTVGTSGNSLIIGPQDIVPVGTPAIGPGTVYGQWKYVGGPSYLNCVGFSNPTSGATLYWSNNSCSSNIWGLFWNTTVNAWDIDGSASPNIVERYILPSTGYTGTVTTFAKKSFPAGVELDFAEDIGNAPSNSRYLEYGICGTTTLGNWHQWGDIRFCSNSSPGGNAGLYITPSFSTTLTGAVTKGTTTSVSVTACPSPALTGTVEIIDTTSAPDAPLGVYGSCSGTTLTLSAVALAAANSGDTIKFMQWEPFGVVQGGPSPVLTTGSCSGSTPAGGTTTGTFVAATCTSSNYKISGLPTAPNGWNCYITDRTTPADILTETASTTTSATISGSTVASDVIQFTCNMY